MSDISLYSGLYETIRRWADLVDDGLVSIKAGKASTESHLYEELQALFSGVAAADDGQLDFSDRRVATMLETKLKAKLDWRDLARRLKDPLLRESASPTLEAMAECLAERHAYAVAKMRSGIR